MTGLILKDLLYLKRTARILIALAVFYLIIFLSAGSADGASGMLSGVITLLTVILSVNAFAYDELAKWRPYELSLPVSKNKIVLARYLLALIFSAGLTLLSLLLELFSGLTQEAFMVLLVSWSAALLLCAVLFPFVYKFGTQKARLILIAVVLLPTFGIALLKRLNLPWLNEQALLSLFQFFPVFSVAAFALSFWISCRIYAKREV